MGGSKFAQFSSHPLYLLRRLIQRIKINILKLVCYCLTNLVFRNQSKSDMIRDILVGAKADDLFDNRCRDGKRRTWSRETDATKWKLVTDETQSLYELGMTEKGQILCEFQVNIHYCS